MWEGDYGEGRMQRRCGEGLQGEGKRKSYRESGYGEKVKGIWGKGLRRVNEIWGRTLGDRTGGLVQWGRVSSASSRHPPVPVPHPGETSTATFRDTSSTLHPGTGRAHVPILVRAVRTPPSHGCHTFPPIPHSASAGAGPGQAPALLGTIRPLSGIQCRQHKAPACRMSPFWWQVPSGAGGSSWPPASSGGGRD